MRAAGIGAFSDQVRLFELEESRPVEPDELLIEVRAAGIGHWDEIARVGAWDLGRLPPMALGVEAAGVVSAVGRDVVGFAPGDRVLTHSAPLRVQGAWAQRFVVPFTHAALLHESISFELAGGFPVPALTADQALSAGIEVADGENVLIHGAGGVTGNLLVQMAARRGARVLATAGPRSAGRTLRAGAAVVVDYHALDWAAQVRSAIGGVGVDAAVNAVRGGAAPTLEVVRDGGRLATITSDAPAGIRNVKISQIYVAPDGARLAELTALLDSGMLNIEVGATYPLEQVAAAFAEVEHGSGGGTVVLRPEKPQ